MSELLLGGVLGITSSLLAWWTITVLLRPKFEISTELCRREDRPNNSGIDYRLKVRNKHRRYPLAITEVAARLEILGIDPVAPKNWTPCPISMITTPDVFPLLRPSHGRIWHLRLERAALPSWAPESADPAVQAAAKAGVAGTATAEQLLNLGKDAVITFAVTARHAHSGILRSQLVEYRKKDISTGRFAIGAVKVISISE